MPQSFRFTGFLRKVLASLLFLSVSRTGNAGATVSPDLRGQTPMVGGVWLETLDLSKMSTGFGLPAVATTVSGNPISIGGVTYVHGIGTHADAELALNLKGNALRLLVDVGVDDDLHCESAKGATRQAEIDFEIWVDSKKVAASGAMRFGQAPCWAPRY
jgi:hypothetical protein